MRTIGCDGSLSSISMSFSQSVYDSLGVAVEWWLTDRTVLSVFARWVWGWLFVCWRPGAVPGRELLAVVGRRTGEGCL